MRRIDRIKACLTGWYHRHIVADDETSRRLAAVDEELDRAEIARRIDQHLRGKDQAVEHTEREAECREV